ncbi:MAG: pyridoxamine 5'-phosphate oxidase family protein [Clostridiales bacterium]|nr:pyridoxamine 5'-phosphate oxidase family protein [Clostridiales bacterium]
MNKEEIFAIMNENPVFHLATLDGDQPRVRGMLLYRADENGIIFHTGAMKDLYKQITAHPKAELCFFGKGVQVRVSGVLEKSEDPVLHEEIFAHPSRGFLRAWKEKGIDSQLQIYVLKNGTAVTWTLETNFSKKEPITL